jgi:RNA polymerase sigma factor (sigma-70 family)
VPYDSQPHAGDRFPPTRWSVIDAARSTEAAVREGALAALFAAYWRPVYKYIRIRWNRPAEDAQDLTQGFFAEILERDLLAKYDPAKSRLRTYLRVCADSLVMNHDKAASRQKRGGNVLHVALDFQQAEGELREQVVDPAAIPSPESMEDFFEKEWIRSLFTLAIEDLRKLCEHKQRAKTFLLFEEYDLDGAKDISYDDLARKHNIPVTDVTNALSWARREFRRMATERLRQICGSEEEFQREALALFGRKSSNRT